MQAGSTYFFTASILRWIPLLKKDLFKQIIVSSLRYLVEKNRIRVYGFVIMPNHIHLVLRIEENATSSFQLSFMRYTAQQFKFLLQDRFPSHLALFKVDQKDRQYQFWQRNSLATVLYTRKVLEQKLEYIHTNPLQPKWNLVQHPEDYRYSSASFYESGEDSIGILTHYMEMFE